MSEFFIVLPYDWAPGAEGDAFRGRIDPLIREIWVRLDEAGFRTTDIKPRDIPGSFAERDAGNNWIIQVDKPGAFMVAGNQIADRLEGLEFPSGSVLIQAEDDGREYRTQLATSQAGKRRLP